MSEKIDNPELRPEQLPTEEQIITVVTEIFGNKPYAETDRRKGGNEIEFQLEDRDIEGNIVQLDYTLNKSGRITIDVIYFGPEGIPAGGETTS